MGAHGQDPLEQGPACAGRAVESRTYPWIFLGIETLPPFPGLLQGRIRRSPAGPAAAPGSGPWHPAGDSQSGARGWEQEKSGFEERGRHRNLHQLREELEGEPGRGGFSAQAMPEAFPLSPHGAGMPVVSPKSLREDSPRSIYILSFGQHRHTQSPAQPCAFLGHPTPPLGTLGFLSCSSYSGGAEIKCLRPPSTQSFH